MSYNPSNTVITEKAIIELAVTGQSPHEILSIITNELKRYPTLKDFHGRFSGFAILDEYNEHEESADRLSKLKESIKSALENSSETFEKNDENAKLRMEFLKMVLKDKPLVLLTEKEITQMKELYTWVCSGC